jgi:flagellar hook-associated protein 2
VSFLLGGPKTLPSTGTPYQVSVTQAASAAVTEGTAALATSIAIDNTNNTFTIKLNGTTSSVLTLNAGTYTQDQLAALVQSKINADDQLRGQQVLVDVDAGHLRIRSRQVGAGSQIAFAGGTALGAGGPLGFDGTETASGLNVAGNFVVNGQTETASGAGQVLSGTAGNVHTDGLQVNVTLTADQVGTGAVADLTVSDGLASRLNRVLNAYLDPANGRFKSIDAGYQNDVKVIDQTISRQNDMLSAKKDKLIQQFAAMEATISRLKATGDQMTAQLAALNQSTKSQ